MDPVDLVLALVPAEVVVDRELHVHVHHVALGKLEGVVGQPAPGDLGLLHVVHAFDEAAQLEHVLGHAFAPLPACLR